MLHYERSYVTARFVFIMLEFFGWAAVVVGVLLALAGVATGGMLGQFARGTNAEPLVRVMAMLPGIGVMIGGFFAVANAQIGRTGIDSTEIARELLALARREASAREEAVPLVAHNRIAPSEEIETYRGIDIAPVGGVYDVRGRQFRSLDEARAFVDRALDSQLRAER